MDRFVASSFYTANDLAFSNISKNAYPMRLEIKDSSSPLIRESHPGNGLFLEMEKKFHLELTHLRILKCGMKKILLNWLIYFIKKNLFFSNLLV